MAYFNFSRLISKYACSFFVLTNKSGEYNSLGDYVPGGTEKKEMHGAIIAMDEKKIYRSEGTLTANDLQLFMLEEIEPALLGATALYNGHKYRIETESGNAQFTDVYAYVLKYVSAFDEKEES